MCAESQLPGFAVLRRNHDVRGNQHYVRRKSLVRECAYMHRDSNMRGDCDLRSGGHVQRLSDVQLVGHM
ncbi:MAG: hypothetical protein Kow0074_12990 [Candidatus Zixiibacteriota bacterium]